MITRKMTPVFSYTLQALSVGIFDFCISRPSKFSFPLHFVLLCLKYKFTCQGLHFQATLVILSKIKEIYISCKKN